VRLYEATSGSEIRKFTGPENPIYSVAFSPNGQTIVAGGVGLGDNRKVYVWNVANPVPSKMLEGHKDDVYRVQFNPKGTRAVSIGYSGAINVWDLTSGKPVFTADLPHVLYSGSYSPDGKRIAVTANDSKVHFVDLPAAAQ
jgi:WD40 repeat protein